MLLYLSRTSFPCIFIGLQLSHSSGVKFQLECLPWRPAWNPLQNWDTPPHSAVPVTGGSQTMPRHYPLLRIVTLPKTMLSWGTAHSQSLVRGVCWWSGGGGGGECCINVTPGPLASRQGHLWRTVSIPELSVGLAKPLQQLHYIVQLLPNSVFLIAYPPQYFPVNLQISNLKACFLEIQPMTAPVQKVLSNTCEQRRTPGAPTTSTNTVIFCHTMLFFSFLKPNLNEQFCKPKSHKDIKPLYYRTWYVWLLNSKTAPFSHGKYEVTDTTPCVELVSNLQIS